MSPCRASSSRTTTHIWSVPTPPSSRCPVRVRRPAPSKRSSSLNIADRIPSALTNTAGSTLQSEADTSLKIEATRVGWPTQSSTAALALLLELAIRLGERRVPTEAAPLRAAFDELPAVMAQVVDRIDPLIADITEYEVDAGVQTVLFSGAGPNLASAIVGAAKVKECTTLHAVEIQIEEYHHYNSQKAGEPLFLFAPSGPSVPRAVDTGTDALRWGGRLYVVTTEGEHAFDDLDRSRHRLPPVPEPLSPLLYLLPAQLVGYHLGLSCYAAAAAMTDAAASLVCVGNLTIDEAVSPAGARVESVGGDALFAALAARLAGGDPTVLAPLGTDAPPALLAAIRSTGTDPATLPRRDLPTIRNVIRYDDTGGRVWDLVLRRGALRGAVGVSRRRLRRRAGRGRRTAVGDGAARTARAGGVAA